ncbi:F120A-like protein [Mya arenaria]|uniref:F120A-like protein n=1 Tax=Mya arenaria TaxID=6604 RepID=A0ABY7FZH2_MYAAR|nr:F120A-like protein [Mya arenaria]
MPHPDSGNVPDPPCPRSEIWENGELKYRNSTKSSKVELVAKLRQRVYSITSMEQKKVFFDTNQDQHITRGVGGKEVELPPVSTDIMRIASERHQKGMMSPWVYQLLTQAEIKMVVSLEDEGNRELPTSMDLFRPIRQTVYSVLLNLNKLKIIHDNQLQETVKEWVVRRVGSQKPSFDLVMARPVDWKTPSIERMWLGQQPDDKTRRLRAFLTCMHSDTPLMLNTNYVPQHLLVLCCVLRYMLEYGRILQRQELDAFLAMSVSPLLEDVQTMQDLKLPSVNPRGVALAALFMSGVEVAQFANDVCGAPVPWNMICPWQFFDGKLFHFKLLKAKNNTPLVDMCDGQGGRGMNMNYMGPPEMGGPPNPQGRGRGILGRSPVDGRGGQLEIAGVVVGSWGPNLSGSSRGRGGNGPLQPRVMSVGGGQRGGDGLDKEDDGSDEGEDENFEDAEDETEDDNGAIGPGRSGWSRKRDGHGLGEASRSSPNRPPKPSRGLPQLAGVILVAALRFVHFS